MFASFIGLHSAIKDEDEMGGAHRTYGKEKNAYKILVRKSEGKRQLGILECILGK
jgi:hypothetical protein